MKEWWWYQADWEKATAWGIVEERKGKRELRACIEICPEEWSNRLIITELWVHEEMRRQGVGHQLMAIAKEQAKREKRRAIILETQSCNVGAIAFYRKEGFVLIGFDSCCYSNQDMQRREVRLDMGYFLSWDFDFTGKMGIGKDEQFPIIPIKTFFFCGERPEKRFFSHCKKWRRMVE